MKPLEPEACKQNVKLASKKSLGQAMRDAGAGGLEDYLCAKPRLKNLHICPTCGGADLHKLGCRDYQQVETMPRQLARAFGRRAISRRGWEGFVDALSGVML
jgi:hypothetical protein